MNKRSSALNLVDCTAAQRKQAIEILSEFSEDVSKEVTDLLSIGEFDEDKPWLNYNTLLRQWVFSETPPERFAECNFPQFKNRF